MSWGFRQFRYNLLVKIKPAKRGLSSGKLKPIHRFGEIKIESRMLIEILI
jgi:hypothetical protein